MSVSRNDLFRLIGFVQDDLRETQRKLIQLRALAASLNIPETTPRHVCPECGFDRLRTPERLADHRRNVHGTDIPLPEAA